MDGQLLANVSRKNGSAHTREYSQGNTPLLSKDIFVAGDFGRFREENRIIINYKWMLINISVAPSCEYNLRNPPTSKPLTHSFLYFCAYEAAASTILSHIY